MPKYRLTQQAEHDLSSTPTGDAATTDTKDKDSGSPIGSGMTEGGGGEELRDSSPAAQNDHIGVLRGLTVGAPSPCPRIESGAGSLPEGEGFLGLGGGEVVEQDLNVPALLGD